MSVYTDQELQAKIVKLKAMVSAYEDAILALSTGAISYSLDTGATRQTVTRAQLPSIERTLGSLENRLAMLDAQLNGTGSYYGRMY